MNFVYTRLLKMYKIKFKSKAIKDIEKLPNKEAKRILLKIKDLGTEASGNIKKLANFTPEYRLRVGNYRVLFEIDGDKIIIYRIKHRKNAYL